MNNKARDVARILAALRNGCHAAGGSMTLPVVEVLLLVAGGVDHSADLVSATSRDHSQITRDLQFLEGRSASQRPGKPRAASPFRLVQRRKHPHRRGDQLRLAPEGIALLRPVFTKLHIPDWT
jgi:hypothetical protein